MNNTWAMALGNLATDVDLRQVAGDRMRGKFLLAVSRHIGKGGRDFIRVVVWGKQAENAGKYLSKGSRVCVMGPLHSDFYERAGDNGEKESRLNTEIVAEQIEYLAAPATATAPEPAPAARGGRR
jgi:single-strand DNA-binding protein